MGQVKAATALPLLNYLRRSSSPHADAIASAFNGSEHISSECWLALYKQAIALSGDSALPLRVGASVQPSDYSMLGFAAMSCTTLGKAIEVMLRYERLVQDVNATALQVDGDWAELQWLPYRGPISPIFMQLALASWAAVGRQLSGQPQAFEAHFTFAAPDHAGLYQEIFGLPARFSQPMSKLVFERSFLDLPVVSGDSQTNQILLQQAEQQLLQAEESEIVCLVRQRIAAGQASVEAVAEDLRMSARKLQQQLTSAGSSFRKLLHEAQYQRAKAYLSDPAVSVSEVAALLGYSEQSPFQHAFKNWAGMTPGAWRKLRLRTQD
jgi:AraC-like DNA-binding protein